MKFYTISPAYKRSVFVLQAQVEYDSLTIINENSILKDKNQFKVYKGKKEADLLTFLDSTFFALSDRVVTVLKEKGVTGWESFPIKIVGVDSYYHIVYPISKAGPITNLEALMDFETENREFDLDSWDKSDIFNLDKTLNFVCTEKVKNILEELNFSNIEIELL